MTTFCFAGLCLPLWQWIPIGFFLVQIINWVSRTCTKRPAYKLNLDPNDSEDVIIAKLIRANIERNTPHQPEEDKKLVDSHSIVQGSYPTLEVYDEVCLDAMVNATKRDGSTIIVKCGATWCPPCVRIAPYIHQIGEKIHNKQAIENKGNHDQDGKLLKVTIADIDVDNVSPSKHISVRSIPVFAVIQNGHVVESMTGGSEATVSALIQKYYQL